MDIDPKVCMDGRGFPRDHTAFVHLFNVYSHPLPDYAVDLPSLYKRSIVFFRSLYSFVRLLPGYELHRRIRHPGPLSIGFRMGVSQTVMQDELGLGGYTSLCMRERDKTMY